MTQSYQAVGSDIQESASTLFEYKRAKESVVDLPNRPIDSITITAFAEISRGQARKITADVEALQKESP